MTVEPFVKEEFVNYLGNAMDRLDRAVELGKELAMTGKDKVVFIGCGAPNRMIRLITHFADLHVKRTKISSYLPAEFMDIDPSYIDELTVVVFGSYSGTTMETVDAAKFCKDKPNTSVSITRFDDSPLSSHVDIMLNFGDTKLGDYSRFIMTSALLSGFLSAREPENWTIHQQMITSLRELPKILADVVEGSEEILKKFADQYYSIDSLFVVGNGPIYNTAYVLAFCSFMEMVWMHATPIIAAEFFHGPFELLDDSIPVVVLIGEDETRQEGLRVKEFCKKHLSKYLIIDAADYNLQGMDPSLRGYFSGVVLDAATRRFMDYYANLRGHDKKQRRYMGKMQY